MSKKELRAALVQHQANHDLSSIGMAGLFSLAITAGVFWQSWLIGFSALLLPVLLLSIPGAKTAATLLLAAIWAYAGFQMGNWIGGAWNFGMAGILGVLGFGAYSAMGTVLEDLGTKSNDTQKAISGEGNDVRSAFVGQSPNGQIPPVAWAGATVLFAALLLGLAVVFNAMDNSDSTVYATVPASGMTHSEDTPKSDSRQRIVVPTPSISSEIGKPQQRRNSIDQSNITVEEWHNADESYRHVLARAWTREFHPEMTSIKGLNFVKVFAEEMIKCIDTSSRRLPEIEGILASEIAYSCSILLEY